MVEHRPNRALIADPDAMKPYQRFKHEGDMLDGENAILDGLLTFDTEEASSRAARKAPAATGGASSSLQERQQKQQAAGFDSQHNAQSPNSQSEDHLRSQRYRNRFELFGSTTTGQAQARPKNSQRGGLDGGGATTLRDARGQGAARHASHVGGVESRNDGGRLLTDGLSAPRVLQQSGVTKAMLAHPRFKREVKRDWKVVPLQLACAFNRQNCDADTLFFRLGIQARRLRSPCVFFCFCFCARRRRSVETRDTTKPVASRRKILCCFRRRFGREISCTSAWCPMCWHRSWRSAFSLPTSPVTMAYLESFRRSVHFFSSEFLCFFLCCLRNLVLIWTLNSRTLSVIAVVLGIAHWYIHA